MERYLNDYINRMRPHFQAIEPGTAHEIASVFLSYKFGLYGKTGEEAAHAIGHLPGGGAMEVLKKALMMVSERAMNLENASYSGTSLEFSAEEQSYVAVVLLPEQVADKETLALDNALLLIYAAASASSAEDAESLEEQQVFAINILETYKTALEMK